MAAVKPSETIAIPSENKFKSLVKQVTAAESDKNESVGRIGSLISNAVEKDHLDKKAFAMFRAMKRMSPSKYATTKAHFEHYCSVWGLDDMAAQQAELVDPAEVSPALKTTKKGKQPKAKADRAPRPGSFAEKMQQQANGNIPEAKAEEPKKQKKSGAHLSPEEIKAIADRAEAAGKPH